MSDGRLAATWPAPPGVVAFTVCRDAPGTSLPPFGRCNLGNAGAGGDDPRTVARNRAGLVAAFGLPSAPYWLRQVHGTAVVRVDATAGAAGTLTPEADAAVTAIPGAVLAVLHADCLPVVLAARDGSEVAVAHAGWRGLAAGVLEATVAAMATPRDGLVAWLGPAAGPDHYEVGTEVQDAFTAQDSGAASAFIATRSGHWRVDLYALARRRLAAVGVTDVHGGDLCTIADPRRFYSHRRDARTGRMATLVWRALAAG